MKGHRWLERKDKRKRDGTPIVQYPVCAEVKYDEIRCQVLVHTDIIAGRDRVEFLSYAGKPLANMQQFANRFADIAEQSNCYEFDLGFEVNGNFNDSYRWVRSTNGIPSDLTNAEYKFILFDLPGIRMPFRDRILVRDSVALNAGLAIPSRRVCYNEDDVFDAFQQARKLGFEGLMIKSLDHLYEPGKRTDGWLKYKPSNDEAGVIVKINEAVSLDGIPLGRAGSVDVVVADGSTASPAGINHQLGLQMFMFQEEFIGRTIDFKYMERDRQGGYRHPVFIRLREEVK